MPVRKCAAQPGAPADRQTAGAVRRRLSLGVMPAGQAASLFWYFQVSGTFESDSPQHVSCSHIGNNQRSGPIRVGRLRPASLVGSLGKRSLNILRSLPAPMIQLAAPIQVHSGGFVRRFILILLVVASRAGGFVQTHRHVASNGGITRRSSRRATLRFAPRRTRLSLGVMRHSSALR